MSKGVWVERPGKLKIKTSKFQSNTYFFLFLHSLLAYFLVPFFLIIHIVSHFHISYIFSVSKFPDKKYSSKLVGFLLLSCLALLVTCFISKHSLEDHTCCYTEMRKRQGKQSVNGKQPGMTTNATTNAGASVLFILALWS